MVGGPHPVMVGGTPSSHGGGWGGTPIHSWWGYPRYPPPSRLDWGGYPGYPPSRLGWGIPSHHPDLAGVSPHHQDLAGVPPTIKTWLGYPPHHPDLTGVPPHPDLAGVPSPSPIEVWTDKQTENSTFPHPSDAGGKKSM